MLRVGEPEVYEHPGCVATELGDFGEHGELVLEDVDLLLFCPALVGGARGCPCLASAPNSLMMMGFCW